MYIDFNFELFSMYIDMYVSRESFRKRRAAVGDGYYVPPQTEQQGSKRAFTCVRYM